MNSLRKPIHAISGKTSSQWWLVAVLGIAILFFPFPANLGQPVERSFRIEAGRFAYSPSILEVNPGDRVVLEKDAVA